MTVQYLPVRSPQVRASAGGRLGHEEFARRCGLHPELVRRFVSLGLVVDLLDRITELETALRVRGHTEPVRPPAHTQQPTAIDQKRSPRWT